MPSKRTIPTTCQQCGTDFFTTTAEVERGGAKFCSRSCSNRSRRSQRNIRHCEVCQTPFKTPLSRIGLGWGKTCSMTCKRSVQKVHGGAPKSGKSPEYIAWQHIKARCLNPTDRNYVNYGGRGITICDAWRNDFAAFLDGVGYRPSSSHTIDRIDNDGGYFPGNVRWATRTTQARNRRITKLLTVDGVTRPQSEWASVFGLLPKTLNARLKLGWTVERALATPE